MTRLVARNSYKYPLLVGLPEFYRKHRGQNSYPQVTKLLTGLNVALVEAMITCPIDRAKVHMMTQKAD